MKDIMKKKHFPSFILMFICILIVVYLNIDEKNKQNSIPKELLSTNKNQYTLLAIGGKELYGFDKINKATKIIFFKSIEEAKKKYPDFLVTDEQYIIFDNTHIVLQTKNPSEVMEKIAVDDVPKELLAKEKDQYSVLTIGEKLTVTGRISKVYKNLQIPSLKEAQNDFPTLQLNTSPLFLVFDNKRIVLKTEDVRELLNFIDEGASRKNSPYVLENGVLVLSIGKNPPPPEDLDEHVKAVIFYPSLEKAQEDFPELQLEKFLSYIVFDSNNQIVLQTEDYKKLMKKIGRSGLDY